MTNLIGVPVYGWYIKKILKEVEGGNFRKEIGKKVTALSPVNKENETVVGTLTSEEFAAFILSERIGNRVRRLPGLLPKRGGFMKRLFNAMDMIGFVQATKLESLEVSALLGQSVQSRLPEPPVDQAYYLRQNGHLDQVAVVLAPKEEKPKPNCEGCAVQCSCGGLLSSGFFKQMFNYVVRP
ncbi:MAG: hypothetical protein A2261_02410 [Candidatus Magasanikbacteria bacterium RIFOXYA2_FULL_44_8]|uniref:Uncharacterized protein n=1 Tax=Candidatus Magasanikbacteria bacterium RIFOXYA2_FULL_44_8 TaxID=1798696 RepID=A0A1F6NLQ0_9BACT|nr:MAG: hypothetical protein A2261_02410 [Candidatus Magasanikbacteria bacterium RIFOXYA2_FULL_44_8]